MTRHNCSCLRSRLSLQRVSCEGRRRRTTSETSTDIFTTTSGNKWCSTMKDTSSWFWGNPSRINPVDLREKFWAIFCQDITNVSLFHYLVISIHPNPRCYFPFEYRMKVIWTTILFLIFDILSLDYNNYVIWIFYFS